MAGIDSTESESLWGFLDRLLKSFGVKLSIVSMVMRDRYSVFWTGMFKIKFCLNSCIGVHFSHQVKIGKVCEMIDRKCCPDVPGFSWASLINRYKTQCWADKLIDADNFSRSASHLDCLLILDPLQCALLRVHLGQVRGCTSARSLETRPLCAINCSFHNQTVHAKTERYCCFNLVARMFGSSSLNLLGFG